MEYISPKKLNTNLLRKNGYKVINAFCERTGQNYLTVIKNCFGNKNPHEQNIYQSRFKFYLNFAINANNLTDKAV